jgi:UMF1 family MFS transporter
LKARAAKRTRPPQRSYFVIGLLELVAVWRHLRQLPQTRRYLIAYMAFNDAIQTVIAVASVFLAQELFVARGQPADESFLIGIVLMVQFVAFVGALLFERVAAYLTTKNAILVSLLLWMAIVVYAYGFLQTIPQAWGMGAVLATVLGGSQALSRSLFSRMIPHGHEASFFGLYEITERGTSWLGSFVFGLVVGATGSYRQAILSLIVLFLIGIAVLLWTDTERAIRDAGNRLQA